MMERYFIVFYKGWNTQQEFNGSFYEKTKNGSFINAQHCKRVAESNIGGKEVRAVITSFVELNEADFNEFTKIY